MFSHPSVNGVVMWGFWEGRHYAPGAALWRRDWSPKPNGQAWLDLVQKEWQTNVLGKNQWRRSVKTHAAFLGDYQITVNAGGRKLEKTVSLEKGGEMRTVEFELGK